jgi:mannose-6-phosphate isomerase-like protein (cupin superfamily)
MSEDESALEPMIVILQPEDGRGKAIPYSHNGEEFVMVLEGVVTVMLGEREFELYPGDSYHIMSKVPHYAGNFTNRLAQALIVSTPKLLKRIREERARKIEEERL